MTNNERLSHILVAIPIAHILGSAFFLYSYCLGFGANIVAYASASDLVSVSINDMVPVYVLSLIVPLLITVGRLSSPHPYAVDKVNSLPVEQRAKGHSDNRKFRRVVIITAIVGFVICVGLLSWNLWNGNQFPYRLIWIGSQLPGTILWMIFCEKRGYSNWTYEAGAILSGFVAALFCIGAGNGQADRFIPYKVAKNSHTACSKAVVLRQLSGRFLAIMPDNSRVFISDDCKIKFTVPVPKGQSPYQEPKQVKKPDLTAATLKKAGGLNPPTTKK